MSNADHEDGLRHRGVKQRGDEGEAGGANRNARHDCVEAGHPHVVEHAHAKTVAEPQSKAHQHGERTVEDDLPGINAVGHAHQCSAQAPAGGASRRESGTSGVAEGASCHLAGRGEASMANKNMAKITASV